MKFIKMHGAGNDFVILDFRAKSESLDAAQITHICDRHFGIGCDQLVVIAPSQKADARAIFYNADGSVSGACGNASRCVADILMRESGQGGCTLETGGGLLECARAGENLVTVNMGAPKTIETLPPLPMGEGWGEGVKGEGIAVDMGNPHCVFFVENVETTPVHEIGSKIEHNPLFPNRTNVEFVQILGASKLRQRTWERGSGETLACGSGACAVAAAAITRGLVKGRNVEIALTGGTLHIEWRESDKALLMTGPVAYVFEGTLIP